MIAKTELQTPFTLKRRTLMYTSGGIIGLTALSLTACGGNQDAEGGTSANNAPETNRPKEAPMLSELVDAGDLPPLEERLPIEEDRLIVETAEFGVYGGAYQGAVLGPGDETWLERIIAFEPLLRPTPDLTDIGLPGLLKSIDRNEEGTEYTLNLREGLRWSDGTVATADDIMFAINDVFLNEELYGSPPEILTIAGDTASAEKVDDHTVRLIFPTPKGDFISLASRVRGGNLFHFPQHYCEQFLPHLNEEAESLAEEAGFGDWVSYWEDRIDWCNNTDRPVLNAWVLTSPLNQGSTASFERNPYYWKIDSDGAQLPFIDRLDFEVVQEAEVMLLKALNGELDFHARHFNIDQNRPVLSDGQDDGDFHFVTVDPTSTNHLIIALNQNHENEELRELFQTKDFRIGLSHAINRQEIIDTVFQRQGEPWQAAPLPDSDFYDESFAKQYTEHDVDLANEFLDAAGITERDDAGFRLFPNGGRIQFAVDITPSAHPSWAPAMDMITSYWENVGISASVNSIENTLFGERQSANEHAANVWHGEAGLRVEMLDMTRWFPSAPFSAWAPRWASWYITEGDGDTAEEPPEEVRHQMDLYREILSEPDEERQDELFREILETTQERFDLIGIVRPDPGFGIVSNDLRNVVESFPETWEYLSPGHTNPPIWYFDS